MESKQQFSGIISHMIESLASSEEFSQMRILPQYTALPKETPLRRVSIAIGIEKVDCYPAALGDYIGEVGTPLGSLLGRMADITLAIGIYSPLRSDGSDCFTIFSSIIRHLMSVQNMSFDRISCSSVRYVRDVSAYYMPCTATFSAVTGIGGEQELYTDVVVKGALK